MSFSGSMNEWNEQLKTVPDPGFPRRETLTCYLIYNSLAPLDPPLKKKNCTLVADEDKPKFPRLALKNSPQHENLLNFYLYIRYYTKILQKLG